MNDELSQTCWECRRDPCRCAALAAPKEAGGELTDDPSEQRPARAWMESMAVRLGVGAAREPTLTLARALSDWIEARLAAPSKETGPFPERFACNGPEGTFWTDDSALANKLIAATFDRDEWTVTDTNPPGDQRQEGESRFFFDHGIVHDRKTGKHLRGTDECGDKAADLLAVLQELEQAARQPMKLHFTRGAMREAIKADPDNAEYEAASPPPEAAATVGATPFQMVDELIRLAFESGQNDDLEPSAELTAQRETVLTTLTARNTK